MLNIENDAVARGYTKPLLLNDYGIEGYYFSVRKTSFGTCDHAMQDQRERLKNGDALSILWPDGSSSFEVLTERSAENTIFDMGHSYTVHFQQIGIVKSINGIDIFLSDLSSLWCKRIEAMS